MDSSDFINRIGSLRGSPLNEEEQDEVLLWAKGRELDHLVRQSGWDVVVEMLHSYVRDANEKLVAIDPVHKDEVLAAHSIVFSVSNLVRKFLEDVSTAVKASETSPEAMKKSSNEPSVVPLQNF